MTKPYTKQYEHLAKAIVTEAYIFTNFEEGKLPTMKFFTENAAWDTGADQTIIAPYIAEAMELTPIGKETINGIGGIQEADVYIVTIGLPNGELKHDFKVFGMDIDDYDVLIGMDMIGQTDFAITNQGNITTFSFQTPSNTTIDFKK